MPGRAWSAVWWERPVGATSLEGLSAVSRLPRSIAERQRTRALDRLTPLGQFPRIVVLEDSTARGPGTVLMLTATGESALAGFSALGRRGVPARHCRGQPARSPLGKTKSRPGEWSWHSECCGGRPARRPRWSPGPVGSRRGQHGDVHLRTFGSGARPDRRVPCGGLPMQALYAGDSSGRPAATAPLPSETLRKRRGGVCGDTSLYV